MNRLHPFYILEKIVSNYKIYAFLFYSLVINKSYELWLVALLVLIITGIIATIILDYLKQGYIIKENSLFYYEGTINKSEVQLPFDNIQNIDTSANLIYQIFGLVNLDINMSGDSIRIAPLKRDVANKIIKQILENNETTQEKNLLENNDETILKLNTKDLFFMGLLRLELFSTVGIIFYLYNKIDNLIPRDVINFIQNFIADKTILSTDVVVFIQVLLVAMILLFIISFLRSYFQFYNFELTKKDGNLICKYGFFDKKSFVINKNRIQSIEVSSNLRYRFFGKQSVLITTISEDVIQEGSKNRIHVIPLADEKYVARFLSENLRLENNEKEISRYKISKKARPIILRYLIMKLLVVLSLGLTAIYFIDKLKENLYLSVILFAISFLAYTYISIYNYKLMLDEEEFILRESSIMKKSISFFKKNTKYLNFVKIGAVGIDKNIFLEKRNLCHIEAYIFGTIDSVSLRYIDENLAYEFLESLREDDDDI